MFHAENLLRNNKLQFWKQNYSNKSEITFFILFSDLQKSG